MLKGMATINFIFMIRCAPREKFQAAKSMIAKHINSTLSELKETNSKDKSPSPSMDNVPMVTGTEVTESYSMVSSLYVKALIYCLY